jgi:uncharacterized protein YeaO (DUF488 family)
MFQCKRAYEKASSRDGIRILVDRLWPRGVSKEEADIKLWIKDISPSTKLREWFNHDPEKWKEFKERYFAELHKEHAAIGHDPEQWTDFKKKYLKGDEDLNIFMQLKKLAQHHTVTFVYAAHDEKYNNAVALQEYIEHHIR